MNDMAVSEGTEMIHRVDKIAEKYGLFFTGFHVYVNLEEYLENITNSIAYFDFRKMSGILWFPYADEPQPSVEFKITDEEGLRIFEQHAVTTVALCKKKQKELLVNEILNEG